MSSVHFHTSFAPVLCSILQKVIIANLSESQDRNLHLHVKKKSNTRHDKMQKKKKSAFQECDIVLFVVSLARSPGLSGSEFNLFIYFLWESIE